MELLLDDSECLSNDFATSLSIKSMFCRRRSTIIFPTTTTWHCSTEFWSIAWKRVLRLSIMLRSTALGFKRATSGSSFCAAFERCGLNGRWSASPTTSRSCFPLMRNQKINAPRARDAGEGHLLRDRLQPLCCFWDGLLEPVYSRIFSGSVLSICQEINNNRAVHSYERDRGRTLRDNQLLPGGSMRECADFKRHLHQRHSLRHGERLPGTRPARVLQKLVFVLRPVSPITASDRPAMIFYLSGDHAHVASEATPCWKAGTSRSRTRRWRWTAPMEVTRPVALLRTWG